MRRQPRIEAEAALQQGAFMPSVATITVGPLKLEAANCRVSHHGQALRLGPIETKILQFLMSHVEHVHSRSKLLGHVWGDLVFIEERTVDVHINRLRHALGPEVSHMIETVRGVGYRLTTQVEQTVTMPLSAMDPTTNAFLAVNSSSSPATT